MAIKYFVQEAGSFVAYGLSTDTKPSSPPANCFFIEIDTSNTYTSSSGAWTLTTNHKFIKQLSDFPAPSGGVITLEDNVSYQILGTVDIGINRILVGVKNTIFGLDRQNDILISSTTGSMFTMDNSITPKVTLIFDNLSLRATAGSLISASGGTTDQVTFITTTISNTVNGGTLTGVGFSMRTSSISSGFSGNGFVFSGSNLSLVLRDSTISNNTGTVFDLTSASFSSSVLISRNFINIGASQTFLNATSATISIAGQLALNVFTGAGTYTTGITIGNVPWYLSGNTPIELNDSYIHIGTTPPANPSVTTLWVDTSQ